MKASDENDSCFRTRTGYNILGDTNNVYNKLSELKFNIGEQITDSVTSDGLKSVF